jgi:hypothetical protein
MDRSVSHRRAAIARLCFVMLVAASMGAPACGPKQAGKAQIGIAWSITPAPPRVGPVQFSCTLWDSTAAQPLAGARVGIEGNMSHAGMRPVLATAHEMAPGSYTTGLDLTMAGDWIILLDVQLQDGRTWHHRVDIDGVLP